MSQTPADRTAEVPRLDTPRMWRLRFVHDGKDRIRVLRRGQQLVLGTSDSADVTLEDPTVSGLHCELRATDEGLRVLDLGSKNGVYVGAGRVTEVTLTSRAASFSLGRTTVEAEERGGDLGTSDLGFVGSSEAMARVRLTIRRFAPLRAPVLVCGESGTGKDVVARALHSESRRTGEYCPLNVAALPDTLLDAELFGHERGAFTGALGNRVGLFEAAHRGTLFLDEIAEMSQSGQAKLLRIVEDGKVRALGAERSKAVEVRVVSATCANLTERIASGRFRHDLFHRLAPLVIEIPPLRKRVEDIPALAEHYLDRISDEVGRKHLTPAAIDALKRAPWPGNVRELFGVLYRAAALSDGDALAPGHFRISSRVASARPRLLATQARELLETHGSVSAAARAAGVPRTTFRSVIERDEARRARSH